MTDFRNCIKSQACGRDVCANEETAVNDNINSVTVCFREKFSGIKPPVLRSEIDFDPGSKYHVAANIPYIR
jgi:hypothetical protein